MALFGSLSTLRSQIGDPARFLPAFDYLKEVLTQGSPAQLRVLRIAMGATEKIELAHGSFALEQAYMSKPPGEVRWESHRAYIDIQVIISGEEGIEVSDVGALKVAEDLTPAKDVLFYQASEAASLLRMGPADGAVFFPIDGHRPSLSLGTSVAVRKTVVKIPVA